MLEKTLKSPLNSRIKPVNPKGNHPFIGRTDTEAPILWPPDLKSWLIGKDPDAGKDWRWEEKEMTEDEMVGWHHWLNGWVWINSGDRVGDGHGDLVCCSLWGRKESDMTEQLNNNEAFSTVNWLVDDVLICWSWGNCIYGLASSFLVPFNFQF